MVKSSVSWHRFIIQDETGPGQSCDRIIALTRIAAPYELLSARPWDTPRACMPGSLPAQARGACCAAGAGDTMGGMTPSHSRHDRSSSVSLQEAVDRGGFYPPLVRHTLMDALDGREATHQIVHVDTHFDMEEVHRHITVLALADDVVVVAHLDDHTLEADEAAALGHSPGESPVESDTVARISTEVVPVSRIRSLILSEVHRQPEQFTPSRGLAEVSLTMNWTGGARFETFPTDCGNPECMVDHGDNGAFVPEDITLRIAATAEGDTAVDEARGFVRALRRACVTHAR